MPRSDFKVRDKVIFGTPNGEKTLGVIEKLNPTKAKVKTLEERGRDRPAGQVWNVPYNLLTPAPADAQPGQPHPPAPREKLVYSPFGQDNDILNCLAGVFAGLSPENLSGDGELPRSQVAARRAVLERKLRGLRIALGRDITEDEVFEWERSRRDFQRQHDAKKQQTG